MSDTPTTGNVLAYDRATARSVDGATGLEWTTDRRPNVGDVITMTIGEDPHPPNTTREETPR